MTTGLKQPHHPSPPPTLTTPLCSNSVVCPTIAAVNRDKPRWYSPPHSPTLPTLPPLPLSIFTLQTMALRIERFSIRNLVFICVFDGVGLHAAHTVRVALGSVPGEWKAIGTRIGGNNPANVLHKV